MDGTMAGSEGRFKDFGWLTEFITPLSWFMRLLGLAGGQMSCISSQMNSLTGQGLGLRNANHVFQGSVDRVRFARTRKIEVGKSSEIHF